MVNPLPTPRAPHFLARLARIAAGALLLGAISAPTDARAGDEDWSLERSASDPALVGQRMSKLRRRPFDRNQWIALKKALGTQGLAARIRGALKRNPRSVALRILEARITFAEGKPAEAASKLAAIEPGAGRYESQVFELRISALESAGKYRVATGALRSRAEAKKGLARAKLLERAYKAAVRGDDEGSALAIARQLASDAPKDHRAHLRVARAAKSAGEAQAADKAYAKAISHARARLRDELTAERARARLASDNPAGAAALLWGLVSDARRGIRSARATWWNELARAHRHDGTTDVLITKLTKWLGAHDGEAAAWRALAQAQDSTGVNSTPAWRKAMALDPRDVESHTALIESLESKGETAKAVAEVRRLVERSPGEAQLGLDLASRLIATGQRELGMSIAKDIEGRAGRRAHTLMLLLDFYNLNDEQTLALSVAHRLVKLKPRKADARIALGEQLYQMNRVPEALKQWAMLPKLTRPPHKGFAKHAEVLSEHGRTGEAIASLKKALKLAPHEPSYIRLRAVLAEEQRRPGLALELWEQARLLAKGPKHRLLRDEARTRVVEMLVGGAIPKRRSKLERAESQARAILDKGKPLPDAVEAGRLLAELYTRRENYPAAVEVQHRMLELEPDDPDRLEELATAQRRAGQVQSALGTLEELLKAEPKRSADVLAEMSELSFEAGDADAALTTATRAAKEDRTQVDALVRLGELHERKGDVDAAAKAYERALETIPGDVRAKLRLAELELTRGNVKRSSQMFRAVLDTGGPPELLREAGRRALDLAEASDSTMELVALAVRRTTRHPEADEPRLFLLEALDRAEDGQIELWLTKASKPKAKPKSKAKPKAKAKAKAVRDAGREAALRRPLVVSLTRGSIGARLRAAEHLGRIGLPDTAVPLARMGATLAAPRDSTATVRGAFERTRITAIRAAGKLRDPAAVPVFKDILLGGYSVSARHAAAWGLAHSGTDDGAKALAPELNLGSDAMVASLGCIALANRPRDRVDRKHAAAVADLARHGRQAHVRHVCAFAEAALTPDRSLATMRHQLRASDPVLAAIAAWRLGQAGAADRATTEALLRRFIGPAGLPRDAAAAALAKLLRATRKRSTASSTGVTVPPPRGTNWSLAVERWLKSRLSPRFTALGSAELEPHKPAIAAAVSAAQLGTRAERAAAARMLGPCNNAKAGNKGSGSQDSICLAPLAKRTLSLTKPRD